MRLPWSVALRARGEFWQLALCPRGLNEDSGLASAEPALKTGQAREPEAQCGYRESTTSALVAGPGSCLPTSSVGQHPARQLRIICVCVCLKGCFSPASTLPRTWQKLSTLHLVFVVCAKPFVSFNTLLSRPPFLPFSDPKPFPDNCCVVVRHWRHPHSPNGTWRLLTTKNLNKTRPAHLNSV